MKINVQSVGDYDLRGQDLRQHYAKFGRCTLSDSEVWALSLAQSVVNESLPNHIGYQAWITDVAGCEFFVPELQDWAVGLAHTYATVRPLRRNRRRRLVEGYTREWGACAALDGLKLAVMGKGHVPSVRQRAEHFGISRDSFQKIRNLVCGSVLLQAWQFEDALGWAVRLQRRAA